jgi:glutamate-1-semialdehyde 2,1-aminomutase
MILAIVQARLGSVRFPNKVMRRIDGMPMIEILLRRLSGAAKLDKLIVATTDSARDQPLAELVAQLGYEVFRGSEADVLDRYYQAALPYRPNAVVRVTGDCPLIDPHVVDEVIEAYLSRSVDYLSNTQPPTYPNGLDVEIFSFDALQRAASEATQPAEREHVTPYLYRSGRFKIGNLEYREDLSSERWTVDEAADFEVISAVVEHFRPRIDFGWQEVLRLRQTQPQLFQANRHLARNEGLSLDTGQKLWKRAQRILCSKTAGAPNAWPAYFGKAQGCRIWDLDGKPYIDAAMAGGAHVLGYAHPEVDDAVRRAIGLGNSSTLRCPEEVHLAERLLEMHPWADKVRFAPGGAEADAAVSFARAANGIHKAAIYGYQDRSDWYLPAQPLRCNTFAELEDLAKGRAIGIIMIDTAQHADAHADFLRRVRALATAHGIVLIFDECMSGFRRSFGGLHLKYGVEPDMAILGKALGNGYAITAALGRREVMEPEQGAVTTESCTDRIGASAALKALEVMHSVKSWDQITHTGSSIGARWKALADKYGLSIAISGLPALTGFSFNGPNAHAYRALIAQEMLAQGYLASTSICVCTEHTAQILDDYFKALDPVFALIRQCEDGREVFSLLKRR